MATSRQAELTDNKITAPQAQEKKTMHDAQDKEADKVGIRQIATPLYDILTEAQEPTPWLIEGLVIESELIMVHGPAHAGKTYVVLDLALRIAFGVSDFHGHAIVGARPVIYVPTEGRRGVSRRIGSWLRVHTEILDAATAYTLQDLLDANIEDKATDEGIEANNDTELPPFFRYDADLALGKSLENVQGVQGLGKFVQYLYEQYGTPPVVLIDVVGDLTAGIDENSIEFKHALRMLHPDQLTKGEEATCTVILVHHEGHTANNRPRGTSGIIGLVDTLISVEGKGNAEPPTLTNLRIGNPKQRNEDRFAPFVLQLQKPIEGLQNPVITGRPDPGFETALLRTWKKNTPATDQANSGEFTNIDPKSIEYVRKIQEIQEFPGNDGIVKPKEMRDALGHPNSSDAAIREALLGQGFIVLVEGRGKGGFSLTDKGIVLAKGGR